MKAFLDSSVILSASGSERSLSRLIITIAVAKKWHLISSSYSHAEVTRNIVKFSKSASLQWKVIQGKIDFLTNAYSDHCPHLLRASKDKPVFFLHWQLVVRYYLL